jgi:DNA-binding GntR family transcriptional regulator
VVIEHSSLAELVAEEVGERVVTGQFAPGQVLSEASIAEELGVSRSPVRQAFHELAAEGLLIIRPRKATIVSPITAAEAVDFYDCRILLEGECSRLTAPRAPDALLSQLRITLDEMALCVEEERLHGYLVQVALFYEAIHAECPNTVLVGIIQSIWRRATRFRAVSIRTAGRPARSLVQHEALVTAFESRDANRTAMVSRQILIESKDAILQQLASPTHG